LPRAPKFWRVDGVASRLLSPLGALYGALAQRRLTRDAPEASLPTIVVGGPTAGGDGKTPLVLTIAALLAARGERPALLTRGYGGRRRLESFVVDLSRDNAENCGDEALLLARHAPTIVGGDRPASARLAQALGASVLVLDDGFHSRRLAADLSLLVVDGDYGAGNGRCIPAGPLRAPIDAQLQAVDALVVVGDGAAGEALAARGYCPFFRADVVANEQAASKLSGTRVAAFAGIGRPEKFFRTLQETGAQIVETRAFPDHRPYAARDLAALAEWARRSRARLVTTEKDACRLDPGELDVDILPIRLAIAEPEGFAALVSAALKRGRLRASGVRAS
jgi:tetraacyldisaccharide 4'-kinase